MSIRIRSCDTVTHTISLPHFARSCCASLVHFVIFVSVILSCALQIASRFISMALFAQMHTKICEDKNNGGQ